MKPLYYPVPVTDIYDREYNGPYQEYTYLVPSKIGFFTGMNENCLMDFKIEVQRIDSVHTRVLVYLEPPPTKQSAQMKPVLVHEHEYTEFYTHTRDVALQVLEVAVDSLRRSPSPSISTIG